MRAVLNDDYTKGDSDFSATELIKPSRIWALEQKHKDEIEIDVDDEMFKLYGKLGHLIVERAGTQILDQSFQGDPKLVIEQRFYLSIKGLDLRNYKISAQIDSLSLEKDGTLIDWKFTTVFGFKKDSLPKDEWFYQMNIQNYLLRENGFIAKKMQIWGLLRDWRPGEKKKDPEMYPDKASFHDIRIMGDEFITSYIKKRIESHKNALELLPECTSEENWSGRRCQDYCSVNKFCEQFKNRKPKIVR